MTTVYVDPVCIRADMTAREGTYWDIDPSWHVLEGADYTVMARDTQKPLAILRRNAIPPHLCALGVQHYRRAGEMISTNRGVAAGMPHRTHVGESRYERGRTAHSSIVGYIDSTRHDRPCRLTAFSKDHFEAYTAGLPFIRAIDACFRACVPDAYARQSATARETPFHIEDTAFSTVTVNLDFRTALHRDAGDYPGGFGNLVVCSHGVRGGHLLFPRYKVAIPMCTGDFLAMDVHEWHCNSPLETVDPGGYRLSFVCYLRERMPRCETTNMRLDLLRKHHLPNDVESLVAHMYHIRGEPVPPKTVIGAGPFGHVWWTRVGTSLSITYKHKRFVLEDHAQNKKVHNLLPALEHVLQNAPAQ